MVNYIGYRLQFNSEEWKLSTLIIGGSHFQFRKIIWIFLKSYNTSIFKSISWLGIRKCSHWVQRYVKKGK